VVPRIKQKVFRNWKKFQNRGKKYDNMTYLVELGSTEGARALGSSLILKIECISSAMEKYHSIPSLHVLATQQYRNLDTYLEVMCTSDGPALPRSMTTLSIVSVRSILCGFISI
jgi:hypothetical protein